MTTPEPPTVETRPFERGDADLYVDLARRAFARVPAAQRLRDTAERVAHLHGPRNPAGPSVVAWARLEGRVVGHAAGLPARWLGADGARRTGWQLGGFVVDPSLQRRGVGRALVEALSRELAAREDGFVYTYPNARSIAVFERHGYVRVASAPTRIAIGRRRAASDGADVELPGGFRARAIGAEEAARLVARSGSASVRRGAFVRDAAWFAWRFLDPAVAPGYRFARLDHPEHGEHAVAIARHAFHGLAFSVLADALPALDARTLPGAVRCAASLGASRLVYFTTNLPAVGGGLTALGTRVPRGIDPRPVELLALPGGAVDEGELSAATILTADWMGF